jgi:hypothetical protein
VQPLKNYQAFYGTRWFITVFTRALHWLLSRHQNAGQSYDIKIASRCFENVADFRYLGTTIINQNLIRKKLRGD